MIHVHVHVPYSGYISSGKMFILSRIRNFCSFYFRSEQPFCTSFRFRLENVHSTRNENEKNEIKLERNIPAIRYHVLIFTSIMYVHIHVHVYTVTQCLLLYCLVHVHVHVYVCVHVVFLFVYTIGICQNCADVCHEGITIKAVFLIFISHCYFQGTI